MDPVKKLINDLTKQIQPLYKKNAIEYWKAATTGKSVHYKNCAKLEKQIAAIYADKKTFQDIKKYYAKLDQITDPLVKRQIDLLYKAFLSKQGDKKTIHQIIDASTELEEMFNTFRAEYQGKPATENELRDILRNSNENKSVIPAWEAQKLVGEKVSGKIIQVVKLRNKLAKQLGFETYYHMSLFMEEFQLDDFLKLVSKIEKNTTKPFKTFKAQLDRQLAKEFKIKADQLGPWNYRDPFFQVYIPPAAVSVDSYLAKMKLEPITTAFYQGIGLDIRPILKKSDLYEKPGKDQHAFCIGINTPKDVRILCNLKSNTQWMETMLHEFGHGVYDASINPKLPHFLRSPAHLLCTEAIALMMERMLSEETFLKDYLKMSPKKAKEYSKTSKENIKRRLLIFTRWCLVMIHFEKALYANPDQDLNSLWWKLVAKYQLIQKPKGRNKPDWAAKIHIATAPVYYHNYLFGEIFASQLLNVLRTKVAAKGKLINNQKVGNYLVEKIFFPGDSKPWNERVEEATGESLNAKYFFQYFDKYR